MVPMASYTDPELANVLTYVRNSFGNRSSVVTAEEIAAVRSQRADRSAFWTISELENTEASLTVPSNPFQRRSEWILDSNYSPELLPLAVDADLETLYTTRSFPFPDQWITLALPETSMIRSLTMNAGETTKDFPPFYAVQTSSDGMNWSALVTEGAGEPNLRIHFETPLETRYLRFTITDRKAWAKWNITDLQLFGQEG